MIVKDIFAYIEKYVEKEKILLFLISIREGIELNINIDDDDIMELLKDKVIIRDYLTRSFKLNIPFYINDTGEFHIKVIESIENRIDEYRRLFKGVRTGNMGNKNNCINLMKKFLIEHNVTFDLVLAATIYYIENTEYQFITTAENFIYKIDKNGYTSKLETIIEEYLLSNQESNLL